jgi:hypothetical protein
MLLVRRLAIFRSISLSSSFGRSFEYDSEDDDAEESLRRLSEFLAPTGGFNACLPPYSPPEIIRVWRRTGNPVFDGDKNQQLDQGESGGATVGVSTCVGG